MTAAFGAMHVRDKKHELGCRCCSLNLLLSTTGMTKACTAEHRASTQMRHQVHGRPGHMQLHVQVDNHHMLKLEPSDAHRTAPWHAGR